VKLPLLHPIANLAPYMVFTWIGSGLSFMIGVKIAAITTTVRKTKNSDVLVVMDISGH